METELTSNFPNQIVSQLKTKEQEANIMIISDLQYIENVDNSEVLGGGGWKDKYKDYYKKYKKNTAEAVADAEASAFGDNTLAVTNTFTVADSDAGVALSGSSSYAKASSYYKK